MNVTGPQNPENIVEGDVVWLKSGSAKMTVRRIDQELRNPMRQYGEDGPPFLAQCEWQVKGEHREEWYPLKSLTKTETPE